MITVSTTLTLMQRRDHQWRREKRKGIMIPTKTGVPAIIILLLTQVAEATPIAVDLTHPLQSATTVTATKRDTPSPTPEVIATASVVGAIFCVLFSIYCYNRWKTWRNARRGQGKNNAFEMAARIGVERSKLAAAKNGAI